MASMVQSDTESNVSGFVHYNYENRIPLYISLIESMNVVNQSILSVENNLKNIVKQAGPLEQQLSGLLQGLPKPSVNLTMETE